MPDHFLALGLPRRPWLDAESVKARFLQLSRAAHPDRHHQAAAGKRQDQTAAFAALNAAHDCLANPRTRIQHLIELQSGSRAGDVHQVPPHIADRFPAVVGLCREAERRLRDHAAISSPLLRARSTRTSLETRAQLEALRRELETLRQSHLEDLRALDARWPVGWAQGADDPAGLVSADLDRLSILAASLAFLDRWIAQLAALSFELADHASLS